MLATLLLSVLAGQRRYAHIDALRADTLAPTLLGVGKLVSEDSARRAFKHVDEEACQDWLERHLKRSYEELLEEDWILDVDATVKPLYGRQEGARLGYNPAKPGRPSHVYHSYMAANIRLLLGVEVQPGNQTAPSYAPPRLGAFLDERKPDRQPKLLRGDAHGGTEQAMLGAEQRGLDYLFRLRQTTGVKRLIARLFASDDWAPAGQGWPGVRGELPLPGWSRSRKVIVWRRQVRDSLAFDESAGQQPRQLSLGRTEVVEGGILYEYAVRATSLEEKLEAIAQLYRDRGDAENNFDERKNPSGWTGSTTRDLKRSRVMAGVIALVYSFVAKCIEDLRRGEILVLPNLNEVLAAGYKRFERLNVHHSPSRIQEDLNRHDTHGTSKQNALGMDARRTEGAVKSRCNAWVRWRRAGRGDARRLR